MSTYSPSLRIELITTGTQAGTWGNTTNTNLGGLIESAIAGYVSVSITSANQAFTALDGAPDQARNQTIALTTTTTAAFNVYAPPAEKTYVIYNASAYAATIYNSTVIGNTTAAGVGVVIPAGKTVAAWSDGTNFAFQNNHLPSLTLATDLAVADGGTGASDAAGARSNLGLGTMATQADNNVAITGGSISGITDLAVADGGTGASSFTSGGLLRGNGASALSVASAADIVGQIGATAVQNATTAANGGVTSVNGLTGAVVLPVGTNQQLFVTNGTFTVPAGVTSVIATVIAGGGGGKGGVYGSTTPIGGNGNSVQCFVTGLTPGASVAVTVGAGGAGSAGSSGFTSSNGTTGGASSFGSFVVVSGGSGGGTGTAQTITTSSAFLRETVNVGGFFGGSGTSYNDPEAGIFYAGGGAGGAGWSSGGGGGAASFSNLGGVGGAAFNGSAGSAGGNSLSNISGAGGAGGSNSGGASGGSGGGTTANGGGGGGGGGAGAVLLRW